MFEIRDEASMVRLNMSQLNISRADSGFIALEKIPAMQRRRLSSIAKIALNNAMQALETQRVDYIIWVSQYGDEHKTLNILSDVLQDQTPSPTQFSTSVHNAIAGLYSILCQDATPSTSLAGSWSDACIEAYAWLKTSLKNNSKVLIVYYDEPLPELYNEQQNFEAVAMSAIVSLESENIEFNLETQDFEKVYALEINEFYEFWNNTEALKFKAWHKC